MAMLGLREFEEALQRIAAETERTGRVAVAKAGAMAEAGAKKNFEGAHSRGEPHEGGDKPNVVSGTLRRSIRTDPVRRFGLADYGTTVAPRTAYARRIQFGYPGGEGRGHQHTRAFPYFMKPAREAAEAFPDFAAATWAQFLHL